MGFACLVGVVAGLALGVVDFAVQKTAPYPWAALANSPAIWAVVAFAVAAAVTGRCARRFLAAGGAGVLAMVVGVVSYYGTAAVWQGDDLANAADTVAGYWYLAGVVIGAVCGVAATWWRTGTGARRVVGASVPVAVLIAEAFLLLRDSTGKHSAAATAGILVAVAVLLAGVLARPPARVLVVLAVSVPLAAVAYAGYRVVGISGFGG